MSEKVLGIFKVGRPRKFPHGHPIQEILFVTPNRVIIARTTGRLGTMFSAFGFIVFLCGSIFIWAWLFGFIAWAVQVIYGGSLGGYWGTGLSPTDVWGLIIVSFLFLAIVYFVLTRTLPEKKEKGYLELPVEDILKADKNNFDVPYSEIIKVELKTKWRGMHAWVEIEMEIMDEEIEGKTYWGKWVAMGIPEKEKTTIEDYENLLRPIFGDKLSV